MSNAVLHIRLSGASKALCGATHQAWRPVDLALEAGVWCDRTERYTTLPNRTQHPRTPVCLKCQEVA